MDLAAGQVDEVLPLGDLNLNSMEDPRHCQTEQKMKLSSVSKAVKSKHARRRAGNPGLEADYDDTARVTRSLF